MTTLFFFNSRHQRHEIRVMVFNATLQQYFSYIVAVSFIGESIQRKPPICSKSLTKLYHIMLYQVHLDMRYIKYRLKEKITDKLSYIMLYQVHFAMSVHEIRSKR